MIIQNLRNVVAPINRMKRLPSDKRDHMDTVKLDKLLRIFINGPDRNSPEFKQWLKAVVCLWWRKRDRNIECKELDEMCDADDDIL